MISAVLAAVARYRRRHPGRMRGLSRPVVSIGNIAVGGRAKSPMAELVARALLEAGERPSILSRGYARERAVETPVVVRDAEAVRAGVAESGDEPLMLAESLDGAIVVVHADRARAGAIAEGLGATVHILDDGFQHVRLQRDIDIVMIDPRDLDDRVMPSGRLREPVGALAAAHAIVMVDPDRRELSTVWMQLAEISDAQVFSATRLVEPPPAALAGARGLLVSGIADGGQLGRSVRAAGWGIAGERMFKDHHRYTAADVDGIVRDAAPAGATFVVTTAKDAVRLRGMWQGDVPLVVAKMALGIDGTFGNWLIERITQARFDRSLEARRVREDGERRAQ